MNTLSSSNIEAIIERHGLMLMKTVEAFIRSNNEPVGDAHPKIVREQCFMSRSEDGKIGFVFIHSTGLYGVAAMLKKDGELSDIVCRSL